MLVFKISTHNGGWVKYLPRTVKWLRAGTHVHAAGPRPDGSVKNPWVEQGVKKCWDSQPAAESSLGTGTGTQDGSTFGGPTGKNPAVFVARTRFAWLPVPIRASRTPLVTVPDFFTPSCTRASRPDRADKRTIVVQSGPQVIDKASRPLRRRAKPTGGSLAHSPDDEPPHFISVPARRWPPFAILTTSNQLKTAARAGQVTARSALRVWPRIIYASETNLTRSSARKSRLAGSKDGLAVG